MVQWAPGVYILENTYPPPGGMEKGDIRQCYRWKKCEKREEKKGEIVKEKGNKREESGQVQEKIEDKMVKWMPKKEK